MKSILILGLGSFSQALSRDLIARGNEVAVADRDEGRINAVKGYIDHAMIADVTAKETLREIGVKEFDTVVVNLGDQIDASILATLHLKQLGAKNVVVKSISDDHAAVLKLIGADQVIFPERDTALRLAYVLSNANVVDQFILAPGYSLIELKAPDSFAGRTLEALDLRNRQRIQVIIVKRKDSEEVHFPTGGLEIKAGDILVVMGRDGDLRRIETL